MTNYYKVAKVKINVIRCCPFADDQILYYIVSRCIESGAAYFSPCWITTLIILQAIVEFCTHPLNDADTDLCYMRLVERMLPIIFKQVLPSQKKKRKRKKERTFDLIAFSVTLS